MKKIKEKGRYGKRDALKHSVEVCKLRRWRVG